MASGPSGRTQRRELMYMGAVVLATAALGRWNSEWPVDVVLAAVLFLACTLHPTLGLAALISGGLASPLSVETGTGTRLDIVPLLIPVLGINWVVRAVLRREPGVLSTRPVQATAALGAAALLAFTAANLSWLDLERTAPLAAQLGGLAVFLLSIGVFVLAADSIRDLGSLARLTWLFLGLGGLLAAARAMPEVRALGVPEFPPGADGSLFWTWLVALAFGQAAFNDDLDWRVRSLLAFLVFAALYTCLIGATAWVSGWLPPMTAVAIALCIGRPRLGLMMAGSAALLAIVSMNRVIDFVSTGDNPYSLGTRLDAWRIMVRIIATSPWLGLGPANYYHLTPSFPIRGYAVSFSSHNSFVDVAAQTGLVGLLCFLWFAVEIGRVGWGLRKRAQSGFAAGFTYGALGGLAGTLMAGMLGDWILPFVYNVTLAGLRASVLGWLFLGGLLALDRMTGPKLIAGRQSGGSTRARLRRTRSEPHRPAGDSE